MFPVKVHPTDYEQICATLNNTSCPLSFAFLNAPPTLLQSNLDLRDRRSECQSKLLTNEPNRRGQPLPPTQTPYQ